MTKSSDDGSENAVIRAFCKAHEIRRFYAITYQIVYVKCIDEILLKISSLDPTVTLYSIVRSPLIPCNIRG